MGVWSIDDLVEGTGGKVLQRGAKPLLGVGTDSRSDLTGKIFFALKGPSFDAHEFVGMAVQKGAAAVVISQKILKVDADVAVVQVEDTLKALQDFGLWHRSRWSGKLIGLTGSNGKTTTKEFIKTILSQKYPCLATVGNLNNHIGVPLTLLELRNTHKFAVIEMGMNHSNEIKLLCELSKPDIVLVSNVGRAHIENFADGIEGIARAKEEIYENAPPKATRIYNMDNKFTALMRARAPGNCEVITYSSYDKDVDVTLKEKVLTMDYVEVQGKIRKEPGHVKIPAFGRQQVSNAMAAASVALACKIEEPLIWTGLTQCRGIWGRGQLVDLEMGAKVLFDAYNSNPDSAQMAMDNFSKLSARGKKYIVAGSMLELGDLAPSAHYQLGEQMADSGPEAVLLVGQFCREMEAGLRSKGFNKNIMISENFDEKLATAFGKVLSTGDLVLVKGSRGMKLERVVQCWNPINWESSSKH